MLRWKRSGCVSVPWEGQTKHHINWARGIGIVVDAWKIKDLDDGVVTGWDSWECHLGDAGVMVDVG
jgi:hypothetical protein